MKNVIVIDIDSDREQQIKFGKPNDLKQPENEAEGKQMILNDIRCIAEALKVLMEATNNEHLKEECVKIIMNEN